MSENDMSIMLNNDGGIFPIVSNSGEIRGVNKVLKDSIATTNFPFSSSLSSTIRTKSRILTHKEWFQRQKNLKNFASIFTDTIINQCALGAGGNVDLEILVLALHGIRAIVTKDPCVILQVRIRMM